MKQKIEAKGEHTVEEVCESGALAMKYDWDVSAYTTKDPPQTPEWYGTRRTVSLTYDIGSVMHYHTWLSRDIIHEKFTNDFDKWALVKWKKTYTASDPPPKEATIENSEAIWPIPYPSAMDILALKSIYTWNDV
jgi:hypothetical protein